MMITYSNKFMSDSLERDFSNDALNGFGPISLKQALVTFAKMMVRGAKATGRFIAKAINEQAEARARDIGYVNLINKGF